MTDRRLKVLLISPDILTHILQSNSYRVSYSGLPKDAILKTVYMDYGHYAFGLVFESPSFSPVPVGERIPNLAEGGLRINISHEVAPGIDKEAIAATRKAVGTGSGLPHNSILRGISLPQGRHEEGRLPDREQGNRQEQHLPEAGLASEDRDGSPGSREDTTPNPRPPRKKVYVV